MSEENVEIVRGIIEAFSDRDADLTISFLAPEIEWEPAILANVEKAIYRGRGEVADAIAAYWELWEVFRLEETEVRDLGDSVLWLGYVHVVGGASHLGLDHENAQHVELRGAKIVRMKGYLTWEEGLEAAGLRE